MTGTRVAVVDLGSNSTRLFLCDGIGEVGPDGDRATTITGLKRGAGPDGAVSPDALARLAACLSNYADRIVRFGPTEIIPVGTSAVRDAPNRDVIAEVVMRRLGVPMRILAGPEEAELAYVGARLAVQGNGPVLVMDIGGGSTELVRGDGNGPGAAVSLDVGAVRFAEQFLHDDPPTPEQLKALRAEVTGLAVPSIAAIGGPAPMVGVAGTMTSLAAIALGHYDPERVHGMRLVTDDVERITAELAAMALGERRQVPGLEPERAATIVAGGLIACAVLRAASLPAISVSERDLLDGVVLRLARSGR